MSSYIVILGGFLTRRGLRNSLHWFLMLKEMEAPLQLSYCALTKEYILVRARTAPPLRLPNICPPNLSPLFLQYTPTTVPDYLTEQAAGEVGWANCFSRF